MALYIAGSVVLVALVVFAAYMLAAHMDNGTLDGMFIVSLGLMLIFVAWMVFSPSAETTDTETTDTGTTDASIYQTTGGASRFTWYDSEGTEHLFQENQMMIVQDNQTGVRYMVVRDNDGNMSGMTAILDSDGSPNLDPEVGE